MAKTYRVGFASLVHDHVWGELQHWKAHPNVEIVAAGDVNAELRAQFSAEVGIENVYNSWQEMIEKEELDIVQAAAENNAGADIVAAAAAKGIHVVSEKPMAARLSQADQMLAAAENAGTLLMVNWPTAWSPPLNTAMNLIKDGAIGDIFYFKWRSAHNGPMEIGCSRYFYEWLYDEEKNGAGALMDYCCYCADMCAYLLGLPQQVTAFRDTFVKDYPVPDDNAVILMKYGNAFGLTEASWTQKVGYVTPNPVVYGTEGALMVSGNEVHLHPANGDAEVVTPEPLPEGRRNAAEYFIHCLETGESIEGLCNAKVSRDAQEILEAGLVSADSGQVVNLPMS